MNNLQLATTLVAPTGTGLLYTAYEQGSDVAVWVNGAGATRSQVSLKRTQPKPTSTFPGVTRLELKRTVYFTVNDVEYVAVGSIVTSIPVTMDSTARTAFFTNLALLARDPVMSDGIASDVIPT